MALDAKKKVIIVKKKKAGHGGHHGGSWKVAYADFVTAMMAFFMVMWILGMDESVKAAIEGYFANPVGYKKGYSAGASPISTGASPSRVQQQALRLIVRNYEEKRFGEIAQRIRDRLAGAPQLKSLGAKIEVIVTRSGLRIELVEGGEGDTFFGSGSAQVTPTAQVALELIGAELGELSNPVVIEGHTDAVAYGPTATYTNWELSSDRANAARRLLVATGMRPERITEVRGLADRELRVPDDPTSPSNRRISILLPFTAPPPETIDAAPGAPAQLPET